MVRTIASDDFFPAGKEFRHLHRVFVGFRAAQRKKSFCQAGNFGKFFAQSTARLGGETWSRKTQLANLFLDRLQHFRMLVANIQIDELRAEVQPAIIIAIPEPDTLGPRHVNRIGCRLNGPREHRVVAVFLHNFAGVRVHNGRVSLNY